MNRAAPAQRIRAAAGLASGLAEGRIADNKTRQGYARERILKLAGYFFGRRAA